MCFFSSCVVVRATSKSSTLRAAHSLLPHMTCVTVTYCFHMLFFVVRRMCNFQEYRVAKTHRVPYLGRASARRIAPTLPRAIRVGPHEGRTKIPESIHHSGVYLHYNFRGLPNYRYRGFTLCVYVRMHTRTYVHACREKDMEREGERDRNSYMYVFIHVHAYMYTHISYTILIEPTTKTSILRT